MGVSLRKTGDTIIKGDPWRVALNFFGRTEGTRRTERDGELLQTNKIGGKSGFYLVVKVGVLTFGVKIFSKK